MFLPVTLLTLRHMALRIWRTFPYSFIFIYFVDEIRYGGRAGRERIGSAGCASPERRQIDYGLTREMHLPAIQPELERGCEPKFRERDFVIRSFGSIFLLHEISNKQIASVSLNFHSADTRLSPDSRQVPQTSVKTGKIIYNK